MKVSYIAINAVLITSSASFTSASLRGSSNTQEISRKAKLDAFTTLMEVNAAQAQCKSKTGCTAVLEKSGYDYCTQMKISARGCGTCNTAAAGGIGMCQGPSVDVDEELDIVSSMNKEELLDIVDQVMDNNPKGSNTQESPYDTKFDAFTTLMEVRHSQNYCPNKNGCAYNDYCHYSKCGPCDKTAPNGGACTPLSVDVDEELDIVNSMSNEELLDIAAKVMTNDDKGSAAAPVPETKPTLLSFASQDLSTCTKNW